MKYPERTWETLGDFVRLSAIQHEQGHGRLVQRLLFTGNFYVNTGAEDITRETIARRLGLTSEELEKPEYATKISYAVLTDCSPELTGFGRFITVVGASRLSKKAIELTANTNGRIAMRQMRDFNRDARRQVRPINIFNANGRHP